MSQQGVAAYEQAKARGWDTDEAIMAGHRAHEAYREANGYGGANGTRYDGTTFEGGRFTPTPLGAAAFAGPYDESGIQTFAYHDSGFDPVESVSLLPEERHIQGGYVKVEFGAAQDWSNEIQFAADLGRNALRVGKGALGAFGSAIYEPFAMAGDTTRIAGAGLYSLVTGTQMPELEMYSSLGRSGMSTGEALTNMAVGAVTAPYRIGFDGATAVINGAPELLGTNLGEGAMMLVGGRRAISEIAPQPGATLGLSFYRLKGELDHPAGPDFALPAKFSRDFSSAEPILLDEGTKLYRVVGGTARDNGPYWSLTPPPAAEAAWRGGNAVVKDWGNTGTHYVEFTVPAGGLPVWSGTAASQGIRSANGVGWIQPGGMTQLFVPTSRTVIPPNLTRTPTPWSKP